jgi:hypothetical protein
MLCGRDIPTYAMVHSRRREGVDDRSAPLRRGIDGER